MTLSGVVFQLVSCLPGCELTLCFCSPITVRIRKAKATNMFCSVISQLIGTGLRLAVSLDS